MTLGQEMIQVWCTQSHRNSYSAGMRETNLRFPRFKASKAYANDVGYNPEMESANEAPASGPCYRYREITNP